jgi:hypothetical protein
LADVGRSTKTVAPRNPASAFLFISTPGFSTLSQDDHGPAALLAALIPFTDESDPPLDHARATL